MNDPQDARISLVHIHIGKDTRITNASQSTPAITFSALNIGGITVFLDKEAAWKLVNVALEILQVQTITAPEDPKPISTIRDVVDDGGSQASLVERAQAHDAAHDDNPSF